jgi:hypothetical protein
MWFDSWSDLVRVVLIGAGAYVTVVAVLRVSGKRTLAKLNAFDLVVTVALGSTLATILLNTDVSWAEGAVALALLAGLQFLVAWSSRALPAGRAIVTARPTLLLLQVVSWMMRSGGSESPRTRCGRRSAPAGEGTSPTSPLSYWRAMGRSVSSLPTPSATARRSLTSSRDSSGPGDGAGGGERGVGEVLSRATGRPGPAGPTPGDGRQPRDSTLLRPGPRLPNSRATPSPAARTAELAALVGERSLGRDKVMTCFQALATCWGSEPVV